MNPQERTLLEASRVLQTNELEAAKKRTAQLRNRARYLTAALFVVGFLALVVAWFGRQARTSEEEAIVQRDEARTQKQVALARRLTVQAELTRNQQPHLLPHSVRLAVESMQRFQSVEAEQSLRFGAGLLPRAVSSRHHNEEVLEIAFSPDGKYIAVRVKDTHRVGEPIVIWKTSNGQEVAQLNGTDRWVALAFTQDGRYLHTASPGAAVIWKVLDGQEVTRIMHMSPSWDFYSKPAVLSYEGRYLALLQENIVEVREAGSDQVITRIVHVGKVESAAFSIDGKYLAALGSDNTVTVWEVVNGQKVFDIPHDIDSAPFAELLTPIIFSPNGEHLATVSGSSVRVWAMSGGQEVTRIVHSGQVTKIAFSADGKYLATAGGDNAARVWETINGRQVTFVTHAGTVNSVAFSPDGRSLATGSSDGTARLWKVFDGREVARMSHKSGVTNIVFSQDGKFLATADKEHSVWVWEVGEGPGVVRIPHFRVSGLHLSPDGRYLATIVRFFSNYNVVVSEVTSSRYIASISSDRSVTDFAFSSNGRLLATAAGWFTKVWEVTGEKEISSMLHQGKVEYLALSPDDHYLATASDDNTVWLWEAISGRQVIRKNYEARANDLRFTPDGKHLVVKQDNNTVVIWAAANGREVANIAHEHRVIRVALSPDGQYLATASDDGAVRIYGVMNGQQVARLFHEASVTTLAFSPNGQHLATASKDQIVRIWDVSGSSEVVRATYEGTAVRFSPDLKHLVTISQPSIRVWEITKGRETARLNNETDVDALSFSSNGKYLVTATYGDRKSIRVWLWQPKDLIDEACARLNRNFTYEEWQQYLGDEAYRKTCENLPIHPSFTRAAMNLARAGDIEGAIAQFRRVLELEPRLALDPEEEARRFVAQGLVEKGNTLASNGDREGAIAIFRQAFEFDASLDFDPEAEAGRRTAQFLLAKGKRLAEEGELEEATALFQQARELDSSLDIDPETESKSSAQFAAPKLLAKGQRLAAEGKLEEAIALFQKAQRLDPGSLHMDPEAEANMWRVKGLLEKGKQSALRGKVKEALTAYEQAQSLDPTLKISAEAWDRLCWNGSLFGYAADVIGICDKAVAFAPEAGIYKGKSLAEESRGLARAMTGDSNGAIEDFQAFVEWTTDEEKKAQYQRWINALHAGENPFTPEEIERLVSR